MAIISNLITGSLGIAAVQIAPEIPIPPTDYPVLIQIIIQIVIGLSTIISLFKKNIFPIFKKRNK